MHDLTSVYVDGSAVVPPDSNGGYDRPFNNRNMQALNVTLRRGEHSSATPLSPTNKSDYSKVGFSKEALLLRSGVTLRRNQRESLSSMTSFSKFGPEGEEVGPAGGCDSQAHGKGGDSSGEEPEKGLEVVETDK